MNKTEFENKLTEEYTIVTFSLNKTDLGNIFTYQIESTPEARLKLLETFQDITILEDTITPNNEEIDMYMIELIDKNIKKI